ncbi:NAD(P)-binding protein [Aspergillus filifer]
MAAATVVFITGVRQGIGRSLLETYLSRPSHIVIGTVRNPDAIPDLQAIPTAEGSKLLLVSIENTNPADQARALATVKAAGIDHIDIFIANAGGSPPLKPLDVVPPEDLETAFATNASSNLLFFQTFKPLLQAAEQPKWVSLSTFGASIGLMGQLGTHAAPAYGPSKAALNWITQCVPHRLTLSLPCLVSGDHVQTGPGNMIARYVGMEQAPSTIEECVTKLTALIDKATREEHSGKFLDNLNGGELPW